MVGSLAFIWAAVEAMVLKGVDVTLYCTVGISELTPLLPSLTLAVGLGEFAFFRHDDGGDF